MKKKDIIEIIKLYKQSKILEKISHLDIKDLKCLLLIDEIKSNVNVLLNEAEGSKILYNNISKLLVSKRCSHTVRTSHTQLFGGYSKCVLCGEIITNDNVFESEQYNDINRNRYYASFIGQSYDEDYEESVQEELEETIYDYIYEILSSKGEDEEIDLVQELKKINPKDCKFIERSYQKDYYILIIGGVNKLNITKTNFITSKPQNITLPLAHYFSGIPKTRIKLIDNIETFNSQSFKEELPNENSSFETIEYNNTEELLKKLEQLSSKFPFNLVIDTSNLYNYEFKDNSIDTHSILINLKKLFPNSYSIKFNKLKDIKKIEALSFLREQLDNISASVVYDDYAFYYVDKDNIAEYQDVEQLLSKTRVLHL